MNHNQRLNVCSPTIALYITCHVLQNVIILCPERLELQFTGQLVSFTSRFHRDRNQTCVSDGLGHIDIVFVFVVY